MGLDLTLLYYHDDRTQEPGKKLKIFPDSRLRFERDSDLFGLLRSGRGDRAVVPLFPFPPGWSVYDYRSDGVHVATTDPYGTPLTYVRGKDLKRLVPPGDTDQTNWAILAFVATAPDEAIYILWWH